MAGGPGPPPNLRDSADLQESRGSPMDQIGPSDWTTQPEKRQQYAQFVIDISQSGMRLNSRPRTLKRHRRSSIDPAYVMNERSPAGKSRLTKSLRCQQRLDIGCSRGEGRGSFVAKQAVGNCSHLFLERFHHPRRRRLGSIGVTFPAEVLTTAVRVNRSRLLGRRSRSIPRAARAGRLRPLLTATPPPLPGLSWRSHSPVGTE